MRKKLTSKLAFEFKLPTCTVPKKLIVPFPSSLTNSSTNNPYAFSPTALYFSSSNPSLTPRNSPYANIAVALASM
ncbi:hypothetical protein CKAH01_08819 [Colletotrichum kahawae]|uniref:Uncharacterized protein n=1 Tax=Colletotrichum kahawae TaxID=34407 RepID=A0AAD9Y1I5_COLKA|nr:hypothetical protein CKAH01_08819 [Colletotrichum kahawae]